MEHVVGRTCGAGLLQAPHALFNAMARFALLDPLA